MAVFGFCFELCVDFKAYDRFKLHVKFLSLIFIPVVIVLVSFIMTPLYSLDKFNNQYNFYCILRA